MGAIFIRRGKIDEMRSKSGLSLKVIMLVEYFGISQTKIITTFDKTTSSIINSRETIDKR